MSGRFFALPLLSSVSLLCIVKFPWKLRFQTIALSAGFLCVLGIGVFHPLSPLRSNSDYTHLIRPKLQAYDKAGLILDERSWYYPGTGLLRAKKHPVMPAIRMHYTKNKLDRIVFPVKLSYVIGFQGTFSHRKTYILDYAGLADPLVAMLPVPQTSAPRIGHMIRYIPQDYIGSRLKGQNVIQDAKLHELYDILQAVHVGPIWNVQRWKHIWKLNTGQYDALVDEEFFKHPPPQNINQMQQQLARFAYYADK